MAICAIPLMLSPTATRVIQSVGTWLLRLIWPAAAYCERLEWSDIPDGPMYDAREGDGTFVEEHDATNCFESVIGIWLRGA